jgi:clan AA aspartic protease
MVGTVYADITLKNAGDITRVGDGHLKESEIRAATVRALVDTGAGTLVISEWICKTLGLKIQGLRRTTFGNDTKAACKLTEPVEIHWKDRSAVCRALVTSGDGEVLLGAIPLEDMDLIVNPVKRELVGAHGDEVLCLVK